MDKSLLLVVLGAVAFYLIFSGGFFNKASKPALIGAIRENKELNKSLKNNRITAHLVSNRTLIKNYNRDFEDPKYWKVRLGDYIGIVSLENELVFVKKEVFEKNITGFKLERTDLKTHQGSQFEIPIYFYNLNKNFDIFYSVRIVDSPSSFEIEMEPSYHTFHFIDEDKPNLKANVKVKPTEPKNKNCGNCIALKNISGFIETEKVTLELEAPSGPPRRKGGPSGEFEITLNISSKHFDRYGRLIPDKGELVNLTIFVQES